MPTLIVHGDADVICAGAVHRAAHLARRFRAVQFISIPRRLARAISDPMRERLIRDIPQSSLRRETGVVRIRLGLRRVDRKTMKSVAAGCSLPNRVNLGVR